MASILPLPQILLPEGAGLWRLITGTQIISLAFFSRQKAANSLAAFTTSATWGSMASSRTGW